MFRIFADKNIPLVCLNPFLMKIIRIARFKVFLKFALFVLAHARFP